jgi:hypothetical protein
MLTIIKRSRGINRSIDKIEIKNIKDFIYRLNEYYSPEDPYVGVPFELELEILKLIENRSILKYQDFFKKYIRNFMYSKSRSKSTKYYWLNRGYSEIESVQKVKEFQINLSKKFIAKKKENPELYIGFNRVQKEYWIKKGFSEEESIEIISKNQSTFSLHKCIKELGEEEGKKKWGERQEKWKKSRSKSKNVTWETRSQSISYESYFNRHGENWLLILLDQKKKNKNISREWISRTEEVSKIYYSKNIDLEEYLYKLEFDKFKKIISGSLINYILKTNYFNLVSKYMEINGIEKKENWKYGNIYYYKGKYYKSDGEYSIGEYLESHNIDFYTQINYKGTRKFTDFYIPSIDTYFELTGMNNKEDSYLDKRNILNKTKYKIIWASDTEFIKKYIYEKIYKNN